MLWWLVLGVSTGGSGIPCLGVGMVYLPPSGIPTPWYAEPPPPMVYLPLPSGYPQPLLVYPPPPVYTFPSGTLTLSVYPPPYPVIYLPHSGILVYQPQTIPTPERDVRPGIPHKGCGLRHTHPLPPRDLGLSIPTHLNRITDTCENITFPQLRWWKVIKAERPIVAKN